jgi:cellulose biosynthesis protein BcsQ
MEANIEKMDVPIIAFFGTKGGVGKTTITSRFAEFISYSPNNPNVLMIDFDVDHRGLTILWTKGRGFSCKTIHDYMTQQLTSLEKAIDVTEEKRSNTGGKLYLIPSAHGDSKLIFKTTAEISYNKLVNTIIELIKEAIRRCEISCVVIDCGPVINPYTAAAAHIADHAFIIGQNEPISYESLSNYSYKIKEFYDGFNSSKMAIILNKVRGTVKEGFNVFAVIPFTLEVVDISEGLENIDRIRLSLFESYIHYIVAKVFRREHSSFVPNQSVVLNDELKQLCSNIKSLHKHRHFKIFRICRFFAPLFFLIAIASIIVKVIYDKIDNIYSLPSEDAINLLMGIGICGLIISIIVLRKHTYIKRQLKNIEDGGAEYIAKMLHTSKGRFLLEKFRKWMITVDARD